MTVKYLKSTAMAVGLAVALAPLVSVGAYAQTEDKAAAKPKEKRAKRTKTA